MKTLTILIALLITACASPVQRLVSPEEQRAKAECNYEAEKATVSIRNGFEQGFMTGRLRTQCMKLRGY